MHRKRLFKPPEKLSSAAFLIVNSRAVLYNIAMEIFVDGKAVQIGNTDGLKTVLSNEGYAFPCGGKGICGRCRGIAPSVSPTALDEKFLSRDEIASGIRLLCDKKAVEGAEISPLFGRKTADVRLSECDGYVIFGAKNVEIGIVSGDIRLFKVVGYPEIRDRKNLRSLAANALLDFLEEFSVAKATTLAVFGERTEVETLVSGACDVSDGDTFPASNVDLPAEDCFVAPSGDGSSLDRLAAIKKDGETDGEAVARVLCDVRLRLRL